MKNQRHHRGRTAPQGRKQVSRGKKGKRRAPLLDLRASIEESKLPLRLGDFYKPLKKPVTVRLDVDVITWFKKGGRKYQTRINAALRSVMEKEMRRG